MCPYSQLWHLLAKASCQVSIMSLSVDDRDFFTSSSRTKQTTCLVAYFVFRDSFVELICRAHGHCFSDWRFLVLQVDLAQTLKDTGILFSDNGQEQFSAEGSDSVPFVAQMQEAPYYGNAFLNIRYLFVKTPTFFCFRFYWDSESIIMACLQYCCIRCTSLGMTAFNVNK